MSDDSPTSAPSENAPASPDVPADASGVPGSASPAHPADGIPLPDHGFEAWDRDRAAAGSGTVRDLDAIPAAEVVSRAAVMLMSASAEKLGLAPAEETDEDPGIDLDEARVLINALAGLLAASQDRLGPHRQPLRDGLRTLQGAFREASSHPDAPGEGPGEKFLR